MGCIVLFHHLVYNAIVDLMLHDPEEMIRAEALFILSHSPNEGFPSEPSQRIKFYNALSEIHGSTLDGKLAAEFRSRLKIKEKQIIP